MSLSLQSILGAEALDAFETPGPVAHGLPSAAYTSEAFFALENQRLFAGSWVFAGFAHDLPRSGRRHAGDRRGPAGATGAERRAGGPRLPQCCAGTAASSWSTSRATWGPGSGAPITPGHTDLDGALELAPYFGGRELRAIPDGFDRARYGLVPVRSETWHDWIFVNLSGDAPPFEDFVAPLVRRLDGVDLSQLRHLVTIDLGEIAANWKLLIENFIEPYHVQFVHPTTTEQPLADHYTVNDPGCLGCAVDVSRAATREDTLSADSRYLTLFPNFVFGLYLPDQVRRASRHPARARPYPPAPGDIQNRSRTAGGRPRGTARGGSGARCIARTGKSANGSRPGRASDAAGGGVLSPVWEDSVRSFQELGAERGLK